MGPRATTQKRKKAPTGKRKTAKVPVIVTSTPKPRPRPRPRLKPIRAASPVDDTEVEDEDEEIDLYPEGEAGDVSFSEVAEHADDLASDHGALDELLDLGSDDEDEPRPIIEITFEVPYKNASRDLSLKSNISFASFLDRVAQKMEIGLTHLSAIGYILPWKLPRTGKPTAKLLEDEDSFKTLIKNIFQYIDEQKAKNKGKGKVKPFAIQLVDTSAPADGKNGGKQKAPPKSSAAPEPTQESKEAELMALIEERHKCQQHGKACFVQSNGEHYQYTFEDLTIWASHIYRHIATLDSPPERLNLTDKCVRQAELKTRTSQKFQQSAAAAAAPSAPSAPSAPAQTSDAAALNQAMILYLTSMLANNSAPAHHNSSSRRLHRSVPSPSSTPSPPQQHAKLPSKRPATGLPINYPDLKSWLEEIQADKNRNIHQEKFTEFTNLLVDKHKLFTIEDVKALSAKELSELVDMDFGMASRLIRFASHDASVLERSKKYI